MKTYKVFASEIAVLDSDVSCGGGTDDTDAIQAVLDKARDKNTGVYLVMDGAALVKQLKLYSNTTIECLNKDCGFYQVDYQNKALITNVIWDKYALKTRNITLAGGTYNQNGQNQEHHIEIEGDWLAKDKNPDAVRNQYFTMTMEFYGVENLLVRDITVSDFRTYAIMVGGFKNVTIQNVWLELPYGTKGNQDGFHFWGPGQFLNVLNCGGQVGDDVINIGPDECDKTSSITDVLIDGIFMDDGEQAVRLLSRGTGRLDRVTIRNITGSYRSYGFYIQPWFIEDNLGNFGNIFIENVDLKANKNTYAYRPPMLFTVGGNIECLTLKNIRHHNSFDNRNLIDLGLPCYSTKPESFDDMDGEFNQRIQTVIIDGLTVCEQEGEAENTNYISVFDRIENLILKNITVIKNQKENGTLVSFSKKGRVDNLVMESVHTVGLKSLTNDESKIKNNF